MQQAKRRRVTGNMGALIAVLNKRDESAKEEAVAMLEALRQKGSETFGIATPFDMRIEKNADSLLNQELDSPIVIGFAFSRILDSDEPQPTRLTDAMLIFEGRIYPNLESASDSETAAKELQRKHEEAAMTFIRHKDGDFVFVVARASGLIAARDCIGLRPLYYGENKNWVGLASVRRALWKIGIDRTHSFPPGHTANADKTGFRFKSIKTTAYSHPKPTNMQTAAENLQKLLRRSVNKRLAGLTEVAIAFSGGLDSAVVAFLAEKTQTDVQLVHVSLENQPETEHAKAVAEELKLHLKIHILREQDVEEAIPKVVALIEEPDPVKVSIGIPFYWTAEKAAQMKLKVMLAGQGADELFGGYKRYADSFALHGSKWTSRMMSDDIARIHETNLERDFKICDYHGVELRLPFASYELARFAAALPVKLKLGSPSDTLRKLVLRRAARDLGLPRTATQRPKKAIQYATGIDKVLRRIARRNGLSVKEYVQGIFQATMRAEET